MIFFNNRKSLEVLGLVLLKLFLCHKASDRALWLLHWQILCQICLIDMLAIFLWLKDMCVTLHNVFASQHFIFVSICPMLVFGAVESWKSFLLTSRVCEGEFHKWMWCSFTLKSVWESKLWLIWSEGVVVQCSGRGCVRWGTGCVVSGYC